MALPSTTLHLHLHLKTEQQNIINRLSALAVMPHPQFPKTSPLGVTATHTTTKLHERWQTISEPLPNYLQYQKTAPTS